MLVRSGAIYAGLFYMYTAYGVGIPMYGPWTPMGAVR